MGYLHQLVSRKWLPVILLLLGFILLDKEWNFRASKTGTDQSPPNLHNNHPAFAPIPLLDRSNPQNSPVTLPHGAPKQLVGEYVLAQKMSRDFSDLPVVIYPDGRRSLMLDRRFMMMSAVVIGPDDKPKVQCFSNLEALKAALAVKEKANGHPSVPSHASY